jgi:hypothetical protein
MLTIAALTLVILAWHANRYTPVKYIYEWIPFLYNLRFPNRLLIVAASPLILLAGYGLQYLLRAAKRWGSRYEFTLAIKGAQNARGLRLSLGWILHGGLLLVLILAVRDVYAVNKPFAFVPRPRNEKASAALSWLKSYDAGLYYTNIGGNAIWWDWTPAAYDLELPVINFDYGRRLTSFDTQRAQEAPFFATPKYVFASAESEAAADAELLQEFDGVNLWMMPEALPFAFSVPSALLGGDTPLIPQDVSPLSAHLDGPNRVVVSGEPKQPGDQLVVLISDYPGWRLSVDGQPTQYAPVNHYLATVMRSGEHTYEFVFRPSKHDIGMGISLVSLVITLGMLSTGLPWWSERSQLWARIWRR